MKRILNIGCGNDTYGTDFIDLYPQRKEVMQCSIEEEKLPFEDNTFDEVRFYFIFEHLKNRTNILEEIKRVLKVGGILDLKTDNAAYWYYALNNTTHTGRYESTKMYGNNDRHYSLFTDHHLMNFFEDLGLEVILLEQNYENSKPYNCILSFKGRAVVLINWFLTKIGPIKRMGYSQIQIIGKKNKRSHNKKCVT